MELVSPHHAARELVHTIRQGQITSLFQKSIKRVRKCSVSVIEKKLLQYLDVRLVGGVKLYIKNFLSTLSLMLLVSEGTRTA